MLLRLLTIFVLGILTHCETPLLLLSPLPHARVFSVDELKQAIRQSSPYAFTLPSNTETVSAVRALAKQYGLTANSVSSFLVDESSMEQLKRHLQFQTADLQILKAALNDKSKSIVLHLLSSTESVPRLLQAAAPRTNSRLFANMSPILLSGLLVISFLGVMMAIALSCMGNLKTNDRFARNRLWVGRES